MEERHVTNATEIAVAVVEHHGEYLIGPRPSGAVLAGFWEFPGGKVRPGEPIAEAAVRECLEETGQTVEVVGEFLERVHQYEHGCVRLHFVRCRPTGEVVLPRSPFLWVKRHDLSSYRFPEGNRALLRLLLTD